MKSIVTVRKERYDFCFHFYHKFWALDSILNRMDTFPSRNEAPGAVRKQFYTWTHFLARFQRLSTIAICLFGPHMAIIDATSTTFTGLFAKYRRSFAANPQAPVRVWKYSAFNREELIKLAQVLYSTFIRFLACRRKRLKMSEACLLLVSMVV